ncbi:hypothetical protein LOTGIDRAFT_176465, partial [Lottia gigantea]
YNFGYRNSYTCHCLYNKRCDAVTSVCCNECYNVIFTGYNFGYRNSYTCHCLYNERCDAVTSVCCNECYNVIFTGYNFGYRNSYTCHCLYNERCDTVTSVCCNECYNVIFTGYNFGHRNSYTCHCLYNERCDAITGFCNSGCLRGWGGPSCQQENIALDTRYVFQSGIFKNDRSQYGPELVVDGYTDTNRDTHYCSDTDYSPWAWWYIDLQHQYFLKTFHRDDKLEYLKGFSVYIDNELCFQHPGTSNPPAVYPIECNRSITGRYVNISNNKPDEPRHFLTLCEVEIYGGVPTHFA